MSRATGASGGVRPSPNIWDDPAAYELENQAFDPDGLVEKAIESLHPLAGATVLDIGCGAGFHLPRFAARGARVIGLEPHLPLTALARRRVDPGAPWVGAGSPVVGASPADAHPPAVVAGEAEPLPAVVAGNAEPLPAVVAGKAEPLPAVVAGNAEPLPAVVAGNAEPLPAVVAGEAERLPLADGSVDVTLARWAYFFGPGCEPGLAEAERVLRPGGVAAFLDNDASRSTFGAWFAAALPAYDPLAVRRFWRRRGFAALDLDCEWRCRDRAEFERIVRIEFAPDDAAQILAGHDGTRVDYAVTLWWRRF